MNILNIYKINFNTVLISLFILISVTPFFETLGKSILYLILSCLIIFYKHFKFYIVDIITFIIFMILLLILSNFNDLLYLKYFSFNFLNLLFLLNITVAFIISQVFNRQDILDTNEKLVLFFVCIGIPFHALLIYKPEFITFLFDYTYGNTSHKTLFILNAHISQNGYYEGRFMSFAWEPGIMQMLINLAIFNRLKRFNYKIDIYILILLFALFLTYSTAGYFICFLVLLLTGQIFKPKFLIILILLLPFIYTAINQAIQYQIAYKLANSDSFDGRYSRLFKIFENWNLLQIIFGRGSNYYDFELKLQDQGGFDSFTNIIQRYGLITFSFVTALLLNNNNKIIAIIILLTFLSQPIWSAPFIASLYFKNNFKMTDLKILNL